MNAQVEIFKKKIEEEKIKINNLKLEILSAEKRISTYKQSILKLKTSA